MEFYDAVNARRTAREFLQKDVPFDAVKRILEAGNKAPTWDHNRSWQYIVLQTDEEKDYAFAEAKAIAEKFDAERYLNMPRAYPITPGQKMYGYAMPRQFSMLKGAPYVVIPLFKAKTVKDGALSALNPFATAWCVIENIFLAAAAEGLACSVRIPLDKEHDAVKERLKVPPSYRIPAFIGIGYADPSAPRLEQREPDLGKQIRFGKWK